MDNPYQAPSAAAMAGAGISTPLDTFKDPATLTRLTRVCLISGAFLSLAALALIAQEYALLQRALSGEMTLDQVYERTMVATLLVSLPQVLVTLGSYVVIGMWIYRVAWNARAFAGARQMDYTPRWSVGWYFIPFANLWKPYHAMKEIWRASAAPARMETAPVSWWLPLWWTLWLASNAAANVATRLSLRTSTVEGSINASIATMISDALNVPLCLVFLLVVNRLARLQRQQQFARHEAVVG